MSVAAASAVALGENGEINTDKRQNSKFVFVRSALHQAHSVCGRMAWRVTWEKGVDEGSTSKQNDMTHRGVCGDKYSFTQHQPSVTVWFCINLCSLSNLWFPWQRVCSRQSWRRQTKHRTRTTNPYHDKHTEIVDSAHTCTCTNTSGVAVLTAAERSSTKRRVMDNESTALPARATVG